MKPIDPRIIPRKYRRKLTYNPRPIFRPLVAGLAAATLLGISTPAPAKVPVEAFHWEHDSAAMLASPLFWGWVANKLVSSGTPNRKIYLSINANYDASVSGVYDIFTAAGSPTDKVDVLLTIGTGVRVIGSYHGKDDQFHKTNEEAIRSSGGYVTGSTVKILNYGYLHGRGGRGGIGRTLQSDHFWNGAWYQEDGESGGDALYITFPTAIDNTNGYILGGGSGGGGGSAYMAGLGAASGGGAGGGAGLGAGGAAGAYGSPGAGSAGTYSGAGAGGAAGYDSFYGYYGGAGGNGGAFGQVGVNGGTEPQSGGYGGVAGYGGYAVRFGPGGSVSFLGGYNGTQVQGAVG